MPDLGRVLADLEQTRDEIAPAATWDRKRPGRHWPTLEKQRRTPPRRGYTTARDISAAARWLAHELESGHNGIKTALRQHIWRPRALRDKPPECPCG